MFTYRWGGGFSLFMLVGLIVLVVMIWRCLYLFDLRGWFVVIIAGLLVV